MIIINEGKKKIFDISGIKRSQQIKLITMTIMGKVIMITL